MSKEEEKSLSIFNEGRLANIHPKRQLDSIVKFHNEFYSFFKVDEFLKMLNEKFFGNKGEILPISSFYGLEPKIDADKMSKSRFNKYLALDVGLLYSSLRSTLRIKGEDLLSNKSDIRLLDISIFSNVEPKEDILNVIVDGKIYIKGGGRSSDGNWNQKAIFLSEVGESRYSTFPLNKQVQAEEIASDLFRGASEILQGFAVQGFISLPEPNSTDSNG
jgi:hypothetical protein